jgi:chromosome segregation ATPase
MHELTLQFQSNLGEKMRENAEIKQALNFTTDDLAETKSRLSITESEVANFRKTDPKIRSENDAQRRDIASLRESVARFERLTSTDGVRIDKIQEENEKLRSDCLLNSAKVQENLNAVRIAEKNAEDYRRNFDSEKEKNNRIRSELENIQQERLILTREKDEKETKLVLSEEKLENLEAKARNFELELRKSLQNENQIKSSSDLHIMNAERKVSAIEIDLAKGCKFTVIFRNTIFR